MMKLHLDGRFRLPGPDGACLQEFLELRAGAVSRISSALSASCHSGHLLGHLPPSDEEVERSIRVAKGLREESDILVSVGIGGSALGAKALCSISPGAPVRFFEGADPASARETLDGIPWERASLHIVSKSGGTLETLVNAALCLERLRGASRGDWRRRVVVTASPGGGRLQEWVASEGVAALAIPPSVGGRFSALTPAGLLPAAFAGLDISAVRLGAADGAREAISGEGLENPALALGLALASAFGTGLREVDIWGYGALGYALALWLQQLWAESLGRAAGGERVGTTPVACRGSEDQHSLLQLFSEGPRIRWGLFLTADGPCLPIGDWGREFAGLPAGVRDLATVQEALWWGTLESLHASGIPVCRLHLGPGAERQVGQAITTLVLSTLWAAAFLGVDPFGQDGVEAGKRLTRGWLESRT